MSLLNEVLRDLADTKKRQDPSPFVPIRHSPSFLEQWLAFSPKLLIGISIALVVFLIIHGVQLAKEPKDKPTLVKKQLTHAIEQSTLQPVPQRQEVFIPSVLVSIPVIHRDLNTEEKAQIHKVFTKPTDREWYHHQLNLALEAVEAGQDDLAIYLLEGVLKKMPESSRARENLSAIYLSQSKWDLASLTIEAGLNTKPDSIPLNTMKARYLYEQNRLEEALDILNKFRPDVSKNPDFYGLQAAILQTLGRMSEAGILYKSLIEIDPSNGQYWLGYGLSLEHMHFNQQAMEAYQRASQNYTVDPTIRSYAESRLKRLQG